MREISGWTKAQPYEESPVIASLFCACARGVGYGDLHFIALVGDLRSSHVRGPETGTNRSVVVVSLVVVGFNAVPEGIITKNNGKLRRKKGLEMAKEWENTKEYFITYGILINAAKQSGLATYQEIAQACGLPTAGSYMGSVVGGILGAISKNELEHGRPFLSALTVGVSGKPGPGFFEWAKELHAARENQDEEDFFSQERKKIYEEWKIPYRVSKSKN
jgi:hypothetical protein